MSALATVELDMAELVGRCSEEADEGSRGFVFDDDRGAGHLAEAKPGRATTPWSKRRKAASASSSVANLRRFACASPFEHRRQMGRTDRFGLYLTPRQVKNGAGDDILRVRR